MTAVFAAWLFTGVIFEPWFARNLRPQGYRLNWFDTDWVGAIAAVVAVTIVCAARRQIDRASALLLYLGVGWWLGFGVLVVGLGFRMTPPRGDNWAGCLGMTVGLLAYCARYDLFGVAWAALATGFLGGIGFATAAMLKLVEITCGYQTNWHSIMEQTDGLFHGLALAAAFGVVAARAPTVSDPPAVRRWTDPYAVSFVLLAITYLNLRKNVNEWVRVKAVPPLMHGLAAAVWFDLGYLALALAIIVILARHMRAPLALFSAHWLGRGQWLYLVFLWWMVVGNFERALVAFAEPRLVTEGVIHLNALMCTLLAVLAPRAGGNAVRSSEPDTASLWAMRIRRTLALGLVVAAISICADWAIVRTIWGDRYAGPQYAGFHIRFGPNATTQRP
jgi:hypothetical protein